MKNGHSIKRSRLRLIAVIVGIITGMVLLYQGGRWLEGRSKKPEARGDYRQRYEYGEIIEVDGVSYRRKENVTTVLLMGVDREHDAAVSNGRNGGQADFLRLMAIDSKAGTISQIQIDRDTMTPITILGVLGNRSGVRTTQICLAHGFGDGAEQSCELTAEAVSNLLLDMPIDHYAAMNMDGISVLNDWAGGVTVTLEDDFSALDPAMQKGKTLTLTGEQAEIYVRGRRSVGVGTNEARMARQEAYVSQLTTQIDAQIGGNADALGALYDALEDYLTTDLSRGRLINMLSGMQDYVREPLVKMDGRYEVGADGFMEFHADDEALKRMVLSLFYTQLQ